MAGEAASDGAPRQEGASLRWLYAPVLVALIALFVLVIAYGYSTHQEVLTDRAASHLRSVSELSALLLDERFERLRGLAVSLATRVRFRQLVAEGRWSEAMPILSEVRADFPFVDRIFLTDPAGVLRADLPEVLDVRGTNFSYRDWYKGVIRKSPYVSEAYRRKAAPSVNVLACACQVRNEAGETVGILVVQVTLKTLLEWCGEIDVGRSGYVYVVDLHGRLAAHPLVDPGQEFLDVSASMPAQAGDDRGKPERIARDPVDGRECLTHLATVGNTGWRLVAALPTEEAFAERRSEMGRLLLEYGLLFLLTACLAWILPRALAASEQGLARAVERQRLGPRAAGPGASPPADPGALLAARVLAWGAAGLCAATGAAVLLGWTLDVSWLKSPSPAWVSMKANTALGLLLAGLALASCVPRARGAGGRTPSVLGRLAAAGVLGIGVLTLLEHAGGLDLGIDQALFQEAAGAVGTISPGRMAPATALCFSMAGAALLLGGARGRDGALLPVLGAGVILLGGVTVVGYLYGVDALLGIPRFTVMAVHTGVAFVVLGLGLLCAHPELSPMRHVLGATLGGLQTRRLLLPLIGVPMLLGWLRLEGQRAGLYETEFGVALFLGASVIILVAVLLWTGVGMARVDEARRRADEARLRGLEALEAANKELEAFSYSVSHDLRAPLRAVLGFGQALEEDSGRLLDDVGREHLRRVRSEAERMGLLIDDLLRLSRVIRTEMRHEEVDLAALAREIVEQLRRGSPERDVEVAIPPSMPARGDAALLRVALQNLLDNAWKFTSRRPHARIEVGREVWGEETVYYVRDDGDGFDPAYAHKLFGAFQRLHTASEFPGTGIGLATVQRIVHRHGGRVWAEGAPGKGATISFVLGGQA